MRRDECDGLPDAGQLDGMPGRQLHERIRHTGIGMQWLGHLRHTDARSVRKQPVRERWQWGVRRQLHIDLLRHRLLLQFNGLLYTEETQRNRQHMLQRDRVFIWPLLVRRHLLQFGLHRAMPNLQQQHGDLWPSHFGPTGRWPHRLCQRRCYLWWKLRRKFRYSMSLSRSGEDLRPGLVLIGFDLNGYASLQWIRNLYVFLDDDLWFDQLLQRRQLHAKGKRQLHQRHPVHERALRDGPLLRNRPYQFQWRLLCQWNHRL
jgi:hypothetical protein